MIYQPPTQSQPQPQPPRKRHPIRKTLLITGSAIAIFIVAAVAIGLAGTGGSGTPAASPSSHTPAAADTGSANCNASGCPGGSPAASTYTPPPIPAGPPVALVGDSMTVTQDGQDAATVTVLRVETSTQPADAYSDGPAKGYFVDILVRYRAKNAFTEGFDASPLDWYAKIGSRHFDEGDANAYEGPHSMNGELDSPTLNAGESTTGWLLFDLPSPHGKIAYAPNYDGGPLGYWKF
jgi:hypothetical protein